MVKGRERARKKGDRPRLKQLSVKEARKKELLWHYSDIVALAGLLQVLLQKYFISCD